MGGLCEKGLDRIIFKAVGIRHDVNVPNSHFPSDLSSNTLPCDVQL